MKPTPDTTEELYPAAFKYILVEVTQALADVPDTEIFKCRKHGLIAWKSGELRRAFHFVCYNEICFRLSTKLSFTSMTCLSGSGARKVGIRLELGRRMACTAIPPS